jgi:hypothetical protein
LDVNEDSQGKLSIKDGFLNSGGDFADGNVTAMVWAKGMLVYVKGGVK